MKAPDVETRITRSSSTRVVNGRESADTSSVGLIVGPRHTVPGVTLLHLEELREQARKLGAPMDTPVYFTTGSGEARATAVRVTFHPEALPEAAEPEAAEPEAEGAER